jgi:hypothetical protein
MSDAGAREHWARQLYKHAKRFYVGGALQLPPIKGYELDIEIKPGVKGFMHRPIPIKSQQLALLHQQLAEWVASGHARLLTQQARGASPLLPSISALVRNGQGQAQAVRGLLDAQQA